MPRIALSRLFPLWIALAVALPARGEAAPKPAAPKHAKALKHAAPKPAKAAKPPKAAKAPKVTAPKPEAAKPATPHSWVLSLHVGGGHLSMEGDSLGRDAGRMEQLRLGHIVAPGVVAGFQYRGWGASKSGLDRQMQIVTVTATGYPLGRGFYLRGGGGVCSVRLQFLAPDPRGGSPLKVLHQDAGFAATAAAGFDIRTDRAIGGGIEVEYARVVAAHIGGNLVTYTAGLNWSW